MSPEEFDNSGYDEKTDPGETLAKARTDIEVLVDNSEIQDPVISVKFVEQTFDHSRLSVIVAPDLKPEEFASAGPVDSAKFLSMVGKSIVIKFKSTDEYAVEGAERREFQGTIYDVSFDFKANYVCQITLHGISNSFKLDQATANKVYKNVKRSDIAKDIIAGAGLNADVAASKATEEWVYCYNETRWDYLKRFARSEGHWLYLDGDKVVVKSPTSGDSGKLQWGKDLGSMRASIRTRGNRSIVRGWDYKKKAAIVEKSQSSTELSSAARVANKEASKAPFSDEGYVDIRLSGLAAKEQFSTAAVASSEGKMSRMAAVRGQSNAPGLKVGFIVEIDGSGPAWNSKYLVTKVEHAIDFGGYYNHFDAIPLDVAHPEWQDPNPAINDFLTGIVTNLDDPEGLGRVKVKFPTLDDGGNDLESHWARVSSQYAGKERGIFFLPELDDEVICCFERGDIQRPIIIGSLWNGKDKPTMAGAAAAAKDNNIKTIYSRSGHQITFSDESGKESIKIIDKSSGNLIIIDTKEQKISIVSDKDVAVEAGKDISLTAKGDVSIEGQNVNIKAKQGLKGEGMQVDLKAKGSMGLEATGNAKLKGAMLDIDGGSMCNVKGGLIKLN